MIFKKRWASFSHQTTQLKSRYIRNSKKPCSTPKQIFFGLFTHLTSAEAKETFLAPALFARLPIKAADFSLQISWRSRKNYFRATWCCLLAPFPRLIFFSFSSLCNPTCIPGNFGLKLQNSPKLPLIHARF